MMIQPQRQQQNTAFEPIVTEQASIIDSSSTTTSTVVAKIGTITPTNDYSNPQQGGSEATMTTVIEDKGSTAAAPLEQDPSIAAWSEVPHQPLNVSTGDASSTIARPNSTSSNFCSGKGRYAGNHPSNYIKDERKLFVGGLPQDITEPEFHAFFSQFGELQDSIVMFDRETKTSRGFGFVTYSDPEVAQSLLCMGDGGDGIGRLVIRGKTCEVKTATPKGEGNGGSSSRRSQYRGGIGGGGHHRPMQRPAPCHLTLHNDHIVGYSNMPLGNIPGMMGAHHYRYHNLPYHGYPPNGLGYTGEPASMYYYPSMHDIFHAYATDASMAPEVSRIAPQNYYSSPYDPTMAVEYYHRQQQRHSSLFPIRASAFGVVPMAATPDVLPTTAIIPPSMAPPTTSVMQPVAPRIHGMRSLDSDEGKHNM